MPTLSPRVSVVVSSEQHQLLSRLAALQGRSQASYVRQMLDRAEPYLADVLETLETIQAQEEHLDEVYAQVGDQELADAQDDFALQLDLLDHDGLVDALVSAPAQSEAMEDDDTEHRGNVPRAANA